MAKIYEQTTSRTTDINKSGPGYTPNSSLTPLGDGPRRKIVITIEVTADFEKRLDNQWMVEREIHADRWIWNWKDDYDDKVAEAEHEKEL